MIHDRLLKSALRNPPLILGISFLILILIGAFLLSLPIASVDGHSVGFVDALFTATSASCVTGLIVLPTATAWSAFGKFIIITLIQIGGLGTMTILATASSLLGKKIGLRERMVIKEQLNSQTLSGLVKLVGFVVFFTVVVELIGAFLLSFRLIPLYGIKQGIKFSLFHSISAFCNAGFDLFGDSIISFQTDYFVNFVIMGLVILGGLGFAVYADFKENFGRRPLGIHTRLVLITTVILLIVGTVGLYLFEHNNPETIGLLTKPQKWLVSAFQSTILRTAGYSSIDVAGLTDASMVLSILLMFIGGSPGSTAGGLKTTTFAILVVSTFYSLRDESDTVLMKRRVPDQTVKKVFALFIIAIALVTFVTFALTIFEKDQISYLDLLFETVSAFGTVGISRGITSSLSVAGKLILTVTMFLGRVGPTTFAMGIFLRPQKKIYHYADGKFIVG